MSTADPQRYALTSLWLFANIDFGHHELYGLHDVFFHNNTFGPHSRTDLNTRIAVALETGGQHVRERFMRTIGQDPDQPVGDIIDAARQLAPLIEETLDWLQRTIANDQYRHCAPATGTEAVVRRLEQWTPHIRRCNDGTLVVAAYLTHQFPQLGERFNTALRAPIIDTYVDTYNNINTPSRSLTETVRVVDAIIST